MLSIDNQTGICTMVNCASKVAKCVADNDCRATMACSKACQDLPRNRSVKRVKICLWSQEQLYTLPNLQLKRNVSNGSNFFLIMLFFNLMKGKPCAVTFARWQTVTRTRSSRMSCSAWSTTSVFRTIQGLVNTDNTCSYKTEDVIKSAKMKTKTRPWTKVSFLLLPVTKEPSPQYNIKLKYWFVTGLFHRKSHDKREL